MPPDRHKAGVDTTRYFREQVLRKRPYLSEEMCRSVLEDPSYVEAQPDGRIRHWGRVRLSAEEKERILRVVTLEDGVTVHNAFFDRDFTEGEQ